MKIRATPTRLNENHRVKIDFVKLYVVFLIGNLGALLYNNIFGAMILIFTAIFDLIFQLKGKKSVFEK